LKEKKIFQQMIGSLSSIKLAVYLITYISIASLVSSLIPQGLEPDAYYRQMPHFLAYLILELNLHHFFSSLGFFIPVFLFFINLLTCTLKRFTRELKKKEHRRHGPDILHTGLLLLILGGVYSSFSHQSVFFTLFPGEGISLPNGDGLILEDFIFEQYEDDRPKDWISVVDIVHEGSTVLDNVPIKVNHPLRYERITFYQMNCLDASHVVLEKENCSPVILFSGTEQKIDTLTYELEYLKEFEGEQLASISILYPGGTTKTIHAAVTDKVGDYCLQEAYASMATGIQLVFDPGFPLVFLSFLGIALGTALTFIQKLWEKS
jgi:cytochrome c biogenesis protein